jgi:CheY-like chemotaxis protein
VPPVLGAEGKLAQVFLNLLLNAAHAIDEGHAERNEVRVRTWAEGDAVFAEVADTGRGIRPEHRARIFEPFFTTRAAGAGGGLGLAISQSLVTELGGTLSFTSEVGRGSQFVVRLPRLPDGWRPSLPPPDAAPLAPRPHARGRVLVVDDEEGIRSSIVRMLGDNHEVVTVASGLAARELLEHDRRFDVVYCDLMMPSLSGMELHAWLTGTDPELAERVVFITGGAFTPGAADYLALVGNLRVEKPLDVAAFRRLTGELVLAARARRES